MHERQPTPQAIAAIRDHLLGVHGRADFDLERDVAYVANNPAGARVIYSPESGFAGALFTCTDPGCAGWIFEAGAPSYGHPERNAWLLWAHPELSTTLLHRVTDPAERAMLLEDWDRGGMGRREVKAAHTRRAQSTTKADRPGVAERRRCCQQFLLARVRRGAGVADAIETLDELRNTDPHAYRRCMGGPDIRTPETFRKYWSDIPIEVRNAARAEGARVLAGRAARVPAP